MTMEKTILGLGVFLLICSLVSARSIFEDKSKAGNGNFEQLDDEGKFLLAWEIVGDEIIFEIEAETLGWVGLGISPQGSMTGADIFIGGVDPTGRLYFSDRFGTGLTTPKVDVHSDWTLLLAYELQLSGKTILKVSRKLNTCDDEDYPIGNDTNRLIYAMGADDTIQYHGPDLRGTRSTNLIHADLPELDLDKVTGWPMILEMEMPKQDTSYWCSFHRGPVLDKKHHVVGFDALLSTVDSLKHTHHFIVYNCFLPPNSNQTYEEVFEPVTVDKGVYGGHCYDDYEDLRLPVPYCSEYLYVWAKGGKQMVFPPNAGYPIGEHSGRQYFMLEIHYDNPEALEGVKFPSGVQFYYTDEIRAYDAGLLTLGHDIEVSMTVPPNTPDYMVVGHCGSPCLDRFPGEGFTIFNSLLHSHLSGRKIRTRHFRGGVELPWIDFDDHYDFDYQQNKPMREYRQILKGDQITVECHYDSTWKNGEVVVGGLSTREEMCESMVWYYPKSDIDVCGSQYPIEPHMTELGITKYTVEFTNTLNKYTINEPAELAGDYFNSMSYKYNWTADFIEEYTLKRQISVHEGDCHIRKSGESWYYDVAYPETFVPYKPVDMCAA